MARCSLTDPLLTDPQLLPEFFEGKGLVGQPALVDDGLLTRAEGRHCFMQPTFAGLAVDAAVERFHQALGRRRAAGLELIAAVFADGQVERLIGLRQPASSTSLTLILSASAMRSRTSAGPGLRRGQTRRQMAHFEEQRLLRRR